MPFCFSKSAVKVDVPVPVSPKNDIRTPISPMIGRSFAQFVDEEAAKFQHDTRFTKGLVRYKDLKDHIKNMENGKFGNKLKERRSEVVEEECSICLENLGPACDVTTTACKHKFHTFCLVETLGNGSCTSCPLCRTEVEKLVPGGLDGASLKLVAKLRINIDAAQWCHRAVYDEVQRKAAGYLHEAESTWASKYLPCMSSKKKKLRTRVCELRDQLDLLEQFGKVNSEGFTKICGKIDRKISNSLAETLQQKYVHDMGYHKDCVEDGNGMTAALRKELERTLGLLGAKLDPPTTQSFFRRNTMARATETLGSITQSADIAEVEG
eukprot:CAMPEP_0196717886 /NCGR_PEP_ID=MMETSP1091-20130531/1199_1 /TAXON_ID=302021 /ORGANISM="Rhodomonas sp., Strain CCMP768" /LENGTH=323 /DNA_ID=CAMNT_0042058397 /DNA_START=17 /DNA_END=988 /DNA_ORIENTATION=+